MSAILWALGIVLGLGCAVIAAYIAGYILYIVYVILRLSSGMVIPFFGGIALGISVGGAGGGVIILVAIISSLCGFIWLDPKSKGCI
jgi:hypothetical protein